MTGAGSATLAFGIESSFTGSVTGAPDYYTFGRNPTVQTLSIDNQVERLREAGNIENVEAVKRNFEGAFTVEATINSNTFGKVNEVVFNNSGTGFTTGRAQSAQVLAGTEHLSGAGTTTKIRELKGVIPTEFEITYNQGEPGRYSLTCLYADEADGSAPGSLTRSALDGDAMFHNFNVSIDASTVSKLQSATLNFSNLYRFHRDSSGPTPVAAVLAAPETTLDTQAIYEGPTYLEFAYGSSGVTTPQDRLSSVSGTVDISIGGIGTVANYELQRLKPSNYEWDALIDAETDVTDPVTWVHSGDVVVTT